METIYADGTPIAAYLEGKGSYDPIEDNPQEPAFDPDLTITADSFAPPSAVPSVANFRRHHLLPPIQTPPGSLKRIHDAWSTALNSRLGGVDNAKFLEHFRYILVASRLLNEYLDLGALQPSGTTQTGAPAATREESALVRVATSPEGVVVVALAAFACVLLLHWVRVSGLVSKRRAALVLTLYSVLAIFAYLYFRRQWLRYLRRNAVDTASVLTANWQSFEVSTAAALSFIQEVELVSKGYRLSTPLPPISRIEEAGTSRRCSRLRKVLHKAYAAAIPACSESISILQADIDEDDLERYYEVYDINTLDAREASGPDALKLTDDDDPESLKSLRILSFRAGLLRRVTLCHLMSLPADGGKPDVHRWRRATGAMSALGQALGTSTAKLHHVLHEMETLTVPITPATTKPSHHHSTPTRERMRTQVRKISALSTGIRGLQAKMQVLREETSHSIEQSDDLTDLGPGLMAQYESIGADLRDLVQAWEHGRASLQSNISRHERRISMASSSGGLRSPVSSLGGLTAVDEDGTPADALRALTGEHLPPAAAATTATNGSSAAAAGPENRSNRSSTGGTTSPADEEILFEALAMPRQRLSLTREERITKMYEERDRQAALRAKRDANTSMLKELESVINLRPKQASRITTL